MIDAEKRRMELLTQTRKMYSEHYAPPAIHPRYQSTYQSLYRVETKNKQESSGTLGVRFLIAILLFCLFVVAGKSGDIDTEMVFSYIEESHGFVDLSIPDWYNVCIVLHKKHCKNTWDKVE